MKILLTGFEPFGGESVNPAKEAVKLVKEEIKGAQIVKCYVPVVFGKAIETVHAAMNEENPDVVLCIKKMVEYMKKANVPAAISNTAGTYVCNHLMYGVRYYIEKEFPNTIGGFMHVPYLHEQVMNKKETASLSKDDVVKAIEASIEAIVDSLS